MIKRLIHLRQLIRPKPEGFRSISCNLSKHYRNISVEAEKFTEGQLETKNSLDKEKKLKILQLEVDVARQEGRRVPDPAFIKEENWEHLLNLGSRSARTKYYAFLWQLEKKKENRAAKKVKKQEELVKRKEAEKKETEECDHIIYSLMHTGFLLRIYDTTINHWNNHRLIQAMQFGEKLVLDCSYDEYMDKREATNAAKQLMLTFADNRMHDEPFDLHFCNVNMNATTMHYLERHIPTLKEPSFPLHLHKTCYTELFPKEKLVYLTPHCKNNLHKYNPDDIYIVGAMVDKINNEPLSLAKAKKLGLRMARLPLDHYLQWGAGSGKSLTINQVLSILLDLKKTGDWEYALRHVPRRKLTNADGGLKSKNQETEKIKLRSKAEKFKFDIDSWGANKRGIRS